jgi:hypothetical protein
MMYYCKCGKRRFVPGKGSELVRCKNEMNDHEDSFCFICLKYDCFHHRPWTYDETMFQLGMVRPGQ